MTTAFIVTGHALAVQHAASRTSSSRLNVRCRQCSNADAYQSVGSSLGVSIPERGAASALQELLLRCQPVPRSPLRQYSLSRCSRAAAMAAADSLITPLESCENSVRSSWHQVVRRRQASSGQSGHHGLWCGQQPSGAASAASRRPLPRGKRNVWGAEDIAKTEDSLNPPWRHAALSGSRSLESPFSSDGQRLSPASHHSAWHQDSPVRLRALSIGYWSWRIQKTLISGLLLLLSCRKARRRQSNRRTIQIVSQKCSTLPLFSSFQSTSGVHSQHSFGT